MAEKQLLSDQMKLIERTRKAAAVHKDLAKLCHDANLPILAREHDFVREFPK